jgi:hypothetical protein
MTNRLIDCHRCRHYFVTWDERFPHGCRRMGFKSRRLPGDDVRDAMSGQDCRLFEKTSPRKE